MNLSGPLSGSHLQTDSENQDTKDWLKSTIQKPVAFPSQSWYDGLMPTALTKSAEEALALFRHHDALAIVNRKKANSALERFLEIISYGTDSTAPIGAVPQCVRTWTRWLADNHPATRQTITEATGVKFTERGTPHTLRWDDIQDGDQDGIPENTIIRFRGIREEDGRGAPPVIYALWSQRFNVNPIYGVGPIQEADDV